MAGWATFATIVGAVAGSLIGLLFVAVSIRINVIAASAAFRNQAAETLGLFGTLLVLAVIISLPGQAKWTLGVEVVALAIAAGVGLFVLDRRAQAGASGHGIMDVLQAVSPNTITSVLLFAADVLLIFGIGAGMYVLVPAVIAAIGGGIASAWLFLTKLTG